MDEKSHLELTFVGRTYMILLYVIASIFLLLILGEILNRASENPDSTYSLYFALSIWITFIAGGIVYEWHRLAFKKLGMERKSVKILLPLFFLLIVGVVVILISVSPYDPAIRFTISVIAVMSIWVIRRVLTMAVKDRLRSVREKEF
jgi:membrane protein implicated in regulation of membrane protease activity